MTTFTTFDRDGLPLGDTRHGDGALAALGQLGIEAGRFERPVNGAVSSTPMLTHARTLLGLQSRYDAVMTDHVRQRPWRGSGPFPPAADSRLSWPEPEHEHSHDDVELRLVLDGRLRCLLRLPTGYAAAVFEAGTWFALPPGLVHAAQAPADTGVDLLRLFSHPHGWVVKATGAVLPRQLLHWPAMRAPLALAA